MTALLIAHRLRGDRPGGAPARAGPSALTSTREPAAARFLAATAVSVIGDWLTTVALAVSMFALVGAAGPAAYMAARVLPRPAGAWLIRELLNRVRPVTVLVGLLVAQMLATGAVLLALRSANPVGAIVAIATAQFFGAAGLPARVTVAGNLRDPGRTLGFASAIGNAAMVAAPALGALLLIPLGADGIIALDMATFAVAAALVATLPSDRVPAARDRTGGRLRDALRSRPELRRLARMCAGNAALITLLQAMLVAIAARTAGGPGAVGLLYSAVGAGAAVGSLLAARRAPSPSHIRLLLGLECGSAALAASGAPLTVVLPLLVVCGAAGAAYQVGVSAALVREFRGADLGAASSSVNVICYAGMGAGALIAAAVAGTGPSAVVVGGSAMLLAHVVASTRGALQFRGATVDGLTRNETQSPVTRRAPRSQG